MLGELLAQKQAAYGDSVGKAHKILEVLYPDGVKPHQYQDMLLLVRVLDKLSRIANAPEDGDLGNETPWKDVAGYGTCGWAQKEVLPTTATEAPLSAPSLQSVGLPTADPGKSTFSCACGTSITTSTAREAHLAAEGHSHFCTKSHEVRVSDARRALTKTHAAILHYCVACRESWWDDVQQTVCPACSSRDLAVSAYPLSAKDFRLALPA